MGFFPAFVKCLILCLSKHLLFCYLDRTAGQVHQRVRISEQTVTSSGNSFFKEPVPSPTPESLTSDSSENHDAYHHDPAQNEDSGYLSVSRSCSADDDPFPSLDPSTSLDLFSGFASGICVFRGHGRERSCLPSSKARVGPESARVVENGLCFGPDLGLVHRVQKAHMNPLSMLVVLFLFLREGVG